MSRQYPDYQKYPINLFIGKKKWTERITTMQDYTSRNTCQIEILIIFENQKKKAWLTSYRLMILLVSKNSKCPCRSYNSRRFDLNIEIRNNIRTKGPCRSCNNQRITTKGCKTKPYTVEWLCEFDIRLKVLVVCWNGYRSYNSLSII